MRHFSAKAHMSGMPAQSVVHVNENAPHAEYRAGRDGANVKCGGWYALKIELPRGT